jgi:hypothetical protein
MPGGQRFINVNAKTGLSTGVQVTLPDLRCSRQQFVNQRWEMILLLNTERRARDVDMIGGGQIDRVVLAALLEGCFGAENFAQVGELLGRRNSPDG